MKVIRRDLEATLRTLESLKQKINAAESIIEDAILNYDDTLNNDVDLHIDTAITKILVKGAKMDKAANSIYFRSVAINDTIKRSSKKN